MKELRIGNKYLVKTYRGWKKATVKVTTLGQYRGCAFFEFDNPIPGGHGASGSGADGYCLYGIRTEKCSEKYGELYVCCDCASPNCFICNSRLIYRWKKI